MNIALQTLVTSGKAADRGNQQENSDLSTEFLADVVAGLSAEQKTLPCKYLYDEAGSQIFEQICELEDYYLTRTEAEIFATNLEAIAQTLGPNVSIIEPGAGNCEKAQPLLAAMENPEAYIPIDISPEILLAAESRIEQALPGLAVSPVVGDFTAPDTWGEKLTGARQVIFFPGSTIGNFGQEQARSLLQSFATRLASGDAILLGVDLVKDSIVLERAYHDDQHSTEAFNKNLLRRINRELGGDFDLEAFAHRAFYHPLKQRVEMHLVSLRSQQVTIAGVTFTFEEGETIHTENSHKYTMKSLESLLAHAGFQPRRYWTDTNKHYALCYAEIL